MRRLAQDRGETRRIPRALRRGSARALAPLAAMVLVLAALAPTASAAPAGCAGKPGSPDRAALLQYCPKGASSTSGNGLTPAGTSPAAPAPQATGSGDHQQGSAAKTDKPKVPLTSYPSTGGVNVMLLLLLAVALGIGVAYGARRWRRRAQAS